MRKFMKKYGYYLLAFALIITVGVSAGINGDNQNTNESVNQTQSPAIEMISPLKSAEVLKWYSDTELFYNSTLKQWESHKAVDLKSAESNDVYSVLDGVVTDSCFSYEEGYCLTIKHDNGLVSVYCSLSENNLKKKGQKVKQGEKIGEMSCTSANECLEGNHLHFEVLLNGKSVDPSNYITFESK